MYTPNSSKVSATPQVVPQGHGVAIPQNPEDLLKLIQLQHKRNMQKAAKHGNILNKSRRQEEQRESYERKLMEFEDFIYKFDDSDRLQRHFEGLKMEMEDDLSMQIVLNEREINAAKLRDKVQQEVEERKRQEQLEREARKKAAEERRAAVVERLRRKAEEEERQRREAAEALARIEEEKVRQEQQAIQELASNRSGFALEEELSRLAQQAYNELLERQQWQQREQEKLAHWEKEQRVKDQLEKERRKERAAALAEKKARLAELQKLQNSAATPGAATRNIAQAREEAARLSKQLRIQNKARFVTRRVPAPGVQISADVAVDGEDGQHDAVDLVTRPQARRELQVEEYCSGYSTSLNPNPSTVLAPSTSTEHPGALVATKETTLAHHENRDIQSSLGDGGKKSQPEYQAAFLLELTSFTSEASLKDLQKYLMAEKRGLRLEQRNRLTAGAQDPASVQLAKELRQKVAEATFKEAAVQKRLQELMMAQHHSQQQQKSDIPVVNGTTRWQSDGDGSLQQANRGNGPRAGTAEESGHGRQQGTVENQELAKVEGEGNAKDPESMKSRDVTATKVQVNRGAGDAADAVFKRAEQLLREGQQLLLLLEDRSTSAVERGTTGAVERQAAAHRRSYRGSFSLLSALEHESDVAIQRRATVCSMEVNQLLHNMKDVFDPIGYVPKLDQLAVDLRAALAVATVTVPIGDKAAAQAALATKPDSDNVASTTQTRTPSSQSEQPQPSSRQPRQSKVLLSSNSDTKMESAEQQQRSQQGAHEGEGPSVETKCIAGISCAEVLTKPQSITGNMTQGKGGIVGESKQAHVRADEDGCEEWVGVEEDDVDCGSAEDSDTWEDAASMTDLPGWAECLGTSMSSAAHHAAFYGYTEVLEFLCRYFDCFVMDAKQRTPLFYAALQNRLQCVACLVALDPQWIDVGDENGDTSLHAAAIANGVETLQFLLSCEVNPDTANFAGLTPCHLARSRAALEALHGAGAQPYCVDIKGRMPIWLACSDGRVDCLEFLCGVMPAEYLLWPDEDGETCLHKAAAGGRADCVEILCQNVQGVEDLCIVNKKGHTAAHVAGSSAVLKVLYENGANLWMEDSKGRVPLFIASFFGRADCIAFLLDAGLPVSSSRSRPASASGAAGSQQESLRLLNTKADALVNSRDGQGDTSLHVACMCGHTQCVSLLLYYIRSIPNNHRLTPDMLAAKAGHDHIARMVQYVEAEKQNGLAAQQIYCCDFAALASATLFYGSRWSKGFDPTYNSCYFLDSVCGESTWERPLLFDVSSGDEARFDQAARLLYEFYSTYNPNRLQDVNGILLAYKNRYTDLFINLANKYNVEDLTIFQGIDFD